MSVYRSACVCAHTSDCPIAFVFGQATPSARDALQCKLREFKSHTRSLSYIGIAEACVCLLYLILAWLVIHVGFTCICHSLSVSRMSR